MLGEIALETGDLPAARHWAASGRQTLDAWPDAGILRPRLERLEQALERACRVEPLTPAERRLPILLPSNMGLKEIARELHISREPAMRPPRNRSWVARLPLRAARTGG